LPILPVADLFLLNRLRIFGHAHLDAGIRAKQDARAEGAIAERLPSYRLTKSYLVTVLRVAMEQSRVQFCSTSESEYTLKIPKPGSRFCVVM